MGEQQRGAGPAGSFEQVVLPHLDAAYNLARWLVRNPHDAEDIVQEAYLRAFKFFGSYQGGDARAWVLKIVRNTCYSFFEKNRPAELAEEFDEKIHTADTENADAEAALLKSADSRMLGEALDKLPVNFREVIVLRELEGMARARAQLRERLLLARAKEEQRGLRK